MTRHAPTWFLAGFIGAALFASGIFALVVRSSAGRPTGPDAAFAAAVDLAPLDSAAVWHEGRLKSFESFAVEVLGFISGRNRPFNQSADFTYLDMIFRQDRYTAEPIIFVKHKGMRAELAAALEAAGEMTRDQRDSLIRGGMIAEPMLAHPKSAELLRRWAMDVVRTAKHVESIDAAMSLRRPEALISLLAMVPPPSGRADERWISLGELWHAAARFESGDEQPVGGLTLETHTALRSAISDLAAAWREKNLTNTNAAVARLVTALHAVAPAAYPPEARMTLQSWYFRAKNMTWVWIIYLWSVVLLLMAVAYRWRAARGLGMGFFAAAFLLHTGALAWRWYVAGRWPNSNMFEAVTTSVWLGTIAVIALEFAARRTPMRNLFALGGATASMAALMAAHFVPQLSGSINNMMPVLHDLWLYIHTNVIIASYALIAMAAITAVLYLVVRIAGGGREYARVGGAAAIVEFADAESSVSRRVVTAAEVLDGATMVLMELSFVMLWAGIIMGAIWADHSWGRPWGWDPKEVFALNTFLVFLVLVHVRLKVRDKGLWSALLALAGCGVMLFNWIVINFVISGLHSYA
jgi:cytochrome c-type biogenesis protein CcsB